MYKLESIKLFWVVRISGTTSSYMFGMSMNVQNSALKCECFVFTLFCYVLNNVVWICGLKNSQTPATCFTWSPCWGKFTQSCKTRIWSILKLLIQEGPCGFLPGCRSVKQIFYLCRVAKVVILCCLVHVFCGSEGKAFYCVTEKEEVWFVSFNFQDDLVLQASSCICQPSLEQFEAKYEAGGMGVSF